MKFHGICIPIFSLKTKKSYGIGDFSDLISFFEVIKIINFNLVQLLPINDTEFEKSPYTAISNIAFNPIYLSLDAFNINEEEKKEFSNLNKCKQLDYKKVLLLKNKILKREYDKLSNEELKKIESFLNDHKELKSYILYKYLKQSNNNKINDNFTNILKNHQDRLLSENFKDCLFFAYEQMLCHEQLTKVKKAADHLKISILCDLPILLSSDSVEVIEYDQFFIKDLIAGAAKDQFSEEGQYWGFPIYNWESVEKSNFLLWKIRFKYMEKFFSHYRIDHILGFFRFFAIPKDAKAKDGSYIPKNEKDALSQGFHFLKKILSLTHMSSIGEDLGSKINGIDFYLQTLNIAQTKILRWEKEKEEFIPISKYPFNCIVSLSNHDTSLFKTWWNDEVDEQIPFCKLLHITPPAIYNNYFHYEVLKKSHNLPCKYCVNLLQEYLALDDKYIDFYDHSIRINIPGTIDSNNWTYRMYPYIEELLENYDWINQLKKLSEPE